MSVRIVAIGGTVSSPSSTEMALRAATQPAIEAGARVDVFGGEYLSDLPFYRGPGHAKDTGREMVEAVRQADALILAAPGYHGTVSGLVKNALDYLEDLAKDQVYEFCYVATTNKTDFFREPRHFDYMAAEALPERRALAGAVFGGPVFGGAAWPLRPRSDAKRCRPVEPAPAPWPSRFSCSRQV